VPHATRFHYRVSAGYNFARQFGMMNPIPDDLLSMTVWHLGLFLPAWAVLTAVPGVRRWLAERLKP
jgi:hypothetical protein